MEDRLKQFLSMENISPAQFADTMGIQRSGVSHLLAGRNKPSYEFILKMLSTYPSLNADWLILGKGKPYKDGPGLSVTSPEAVQIPVNETIEPEIQLPELAENPKNEQPLPTTNKNRERKIEKILIFYSDGTYEEK